MTFSTNQNRHLYVATAYNASVTDASNVGTIGAVKCVDGELYIKYKGPDTVIKTDRIPLKNLDYVKAFKASSMASKMRKVKLTLDTNVNSGAPVSGQDYVLRINFRQFYGMSDQDQYFKDAAVHATASMTASNFYKEMVKALNRAFSREVGATATTNPYLSFKIGYSTSSESEEGDTNWASATATSIIMEEKPQSWTRGTEAQERVYFDIFPTTIYIGGDDVIWGTVTELDPVTTIGNGKKIADLEWFCMGERGDQYRQISWPNDIPTTYLADPTKEYHVLEFHFAFTDTGVNSYRSEKDITIAVLKGESTANYTAINNLISAINTAASLSIATLSD